MSTTDSEAKRLRSNLTLKIDNPSEENGATPKCDAFKSPGYGWRHIQFLLMFFFIVGSFLHRTSLSVAIVAMTTQEIPDQEVYNWSKNTQGTIIGSFLWGYAVTQVPAGYLTTRIGAKRLLGLSLILSSVISLCIPIVSRQWDWIGLTVLRVCTGLVQGITFPGTFTLLGKWSVPQERSTSSAFTITAQPTGIFLAMALSGVVAVSLGWQYIFYIFGGITLAFSVVWFLLAADTPEMHPYISQIEKSYIQHSIGTASRSPSGQTPWRQILTSMPFISTIVANVGSAWCLWFLLAALPRYINDIFQLPLSQNGVVSGAPFFLTAVFGQVCGVTSDAILRRQWISTLHARKLMNTIGCFGPALLFLAVNFTPAENKIAQIVELSLAVGLVGGCYSGFMVNFVDLSPRYSGLTFAISNFVASLISALAPPISGALVDNLGDDVGWSTSFYLAASISAAGHLFYLIFASVELQPWNDEKSQTGIENPTFNPS